MLFNVVFGLRHSANLFVDRPFVPNAASADALRASTTPVGMNPIVTLEKQRPNMIGNLV
jgi:hypothetical protein